MHKQIILVNVFQMSVSSVAQRGILAKNSMKCIQYMWKITQKISPNEQFHKFEGIRLFISVGRWDYKDYIQMFSSSDMQRSFMLVNLFQILNPSLMKLLNIFFKHHLVYVWISSTDMNKFKNWKI